MSATARSTQEASSLIRSTVDEVREVAPGLYLGPAALLVKGKPKPILFSPSTFRQLKVR